MKKNGTLLKAVGAAALVLAAVPLLAGCGTVVNAVGHNSVSLTPTQARAKIDKVFAESFSGVKPPLKWWDAWPEVDPNTNSLNGEYDGTAQVTEDRYILTTVAADKRPTLLSMLTSTWRHLGFSVDTSPHLNAPGGWAVGSAGDGTRASVQVSDAGGIELDVTVGNIADPEPDKENSLFGPEPPQPTDATGNPTVPKVNDPYWSH